MDQLDEQFREIQQLLSDISDVRLSVGEDSTNVDDKCNSLNTSNNNVSSNNSNRSPNSTSNQCHDNNNYYNKNDQNNNDYVNISNNNVSVMISSATESESSEEECTDEIVDDQRDYSSPQYNSNCNTNNKYISDRNNNNNKAISSSENPKRHWPKSTNKPLFGNSTSNNHLEVVSFVSKPNSSVNADLDYIVSESNDTGIDPKVESYDRVSNGNTSGYLYSTTGEMSDRETLNDEDKSGRISRPQPDEMTERLLVSEIPDDTCCTSCGGCCGGCTFRLCTCLWFLVSSILFILDITSDLCLAIHYTIRLHQVWASLTFILFFLPWMYNIYSFYKFQRCERNVWERWCGSFFLLLGLYPVFRSLVALLDKLYARRHNNREQRNPSDPENNGISAAEIFMMTVLLQDIPQLFLQHFIIGRRNIIDAPVMFSMVTSFLCIIITVSSGFAAITQGQYEWMSDNVEMFLLQPCQKKILQSRILKNEWKDFYESTPSFDPLLIEVERSKEKLKTRMAAVMANTQLNSWSCKWKYYISTVPIYVLMTFSFVPGVSLFASMEEARFPWMALVVYFTVHLYVTWSLLCCRGAIYLPIHKLRRPLINYTICKCKCRACAMQFSFLLQIVFFLIANAFISVWSSSTAQFVAQTSNTSALQCLPSYIWPNTLPVLKTFQVVPLNGNTTASTEWFSCQANYTFNQESKNIISLVINWMVTFQICLSDHVTVIYWLVTISSILLLVYHFLLVCQPNVEVSLNQQTQLWRRIFDERKNLWDKIAEEQKTLKAWDQAKASKTIQRNEVWCTTVNKCVYGNWKQKATQL